MGRVLPGKVERLFMLFRTAVESEREAQAMYKEAIGLCQDTVTCAALRGLLDDEVRHEREIIARYNALRTKYDLDA